MNGNNWFTDQNFQVSHHLSDTFKVNEGFGYVYGLRVELDNHAYLTADSYPQNVYIDAWMDGDASSTWKPQHKIVMSNQNNSNYIDGNGKQHLVLKIAVINGDDDVEDLRAGSLLDEKINKNAEDIDSTIKVFETVSEYKKYNKKLPIGKKIHLNDHNTDFTVIEGDDDSNDKDIFSNNTTGQSIKKSAKDVTDIFVIYGQSNAKGSANGTEGRAEITTHAKYWSRINQDIRHLIYDSESCSDQGSGSLSTGHAWGAFANTYYELTGKKMLFVIGAVGGKSVEELSKNNATGIYNDTLVEFNKAIAALDGDVGEVNVLFHQGESDMSQETSWDDYFDQLTELFIDLRNDFEAVGVYVATVGNPSTRNEVDWHRIRNAQEYVCDRQKEVTVAFSGFKYFTELNDLLRSDGTHATQKGYNKMGDGMARSVAAGMTTGGGGGDREYFQDLSNSVVSKQRVKHILGVIELTEGGAKLMTRDSSAQYVSSHITGVSVGNTELLIECEGLRNHASYGAVALVSDKNNPTEIIHASTRVTETGNNKLAIGIRLNKDFTFAVQTDAVGRGLYKQLRNTADPIDIYDTDSLNIDDSGNYIEINHNTNLNPMIITRGAHEQNVPSLGEAVFAARNRDSQHVVPKDIGWLTCLLPSFTIRPNSVKAGTSLLITVSCMATSRAE